MWLTSVICPVITTCLHMDRDMDMDSPVHMDNWVDTVDMGNTLPEKIKLQRFETMTV